MSVNEPEGSPKPPIVGDQLINGAREPVDVLADVEHGARNGARPANGRRAALPAIDWREERRGTLPGNRYVRVLRSADRGFTEVGPSTLRAGERANAPGRAPGAC